MIVPVVCVWCHSSKYCTILPIVSIMGNLKFFLEIKYFPDRLTRFLGAWMDKEPEPNNCKWLTCIRNDTGGRLGFSRPGKVMENHENFFSFSRPGKLWNFVKKDRSYWKVMEFVPNILSTFCGFYHQMNKMHRSTYITCAWFFILKFYIQTVY